MKPSPFAHSCDGTFREGDCVRTRSEAEQYAYDRRQQIIKDMAEYLPHLHKKTLTVHERQRAARERERQLQLSHYASSRLLSEFSSSPTTANYNNKDSDERNYNSIESEGRNEENKTAAHRRLGRKEDTPFTSNGSENENNGAEAVKEEGQQQQKLERGENRGDEPRGQQHIHRGAQRRVSIIVDNDDATASHNKYSRERRQQQQQQQYQGQEQDETHAEGTNDVDLSCAVNSLSPVRSPQEEEEGQGVKADNKRGSDKKENNNNLNTRRVSATSATSSQGGGGGGGGGDSSVPYHQRRRRNSSTRFLHSSSSSNGGISAGNRRPLPSFLEESSVAERAGIDMGSAEKCWESLTQGTWLNNKRRPLYVGTVLAVNIAEQTVLVSVWRKDDYYYTQEKRPLRAIPWSEVEKITSLVFSQICKKSYLRQSQREGEMKQDNVDDATPFALLEFNNRVVADILERSKVFALPSSSSSGSAVRGTGSLSPSFAFRSNTDHSRRNVTSPSLRIHSSNPREQTPSVAVQGHTRSSAGAGSGTPKKSDLTSLHSEEEITMWPKSTSDGGDVLVDLGRITLQSAYGQRASGGYVRSAKETLRTKGAEVYVAPYGKEHSDIISEEREGDRKDIFLITKTGNARILGKFDGRASTPASPPSFSPPPQQRVLSTALKLRPVTTGGAKVDEQQQRPPTRSQLLSRGIIPAIAIRTVKGKRMEKSVVGVGVAAAAAASAYASTNTNTPTTATLGQGSSPTTETEKSQIDPRVGVVLRRLKHASRLEELSERCELSGGVGAGLGLGGDGIDVSHMDSEDQHHYYMTLAGAKSAFIGGLRRPQSVGASPIRGGQEGHEEVSTSLSPHTSLSLLPATFQRHVATRGSSRNGGRIGGSLLANDFVRKRGRGDILGDPIPVIKPIVDELEAVRPLANELWQAGIKIKKAPRTPFYELEADRIASQLFEAKERGKSVE